MKIQYITHACFKISSDEGRGVNILIDPIAAKMGKIPHQKDIDILLTSHSHPDHYGLDNDIDKTYFHIETPGEYDLKDVFIEGISTYHDKVKGAERGLNTVYTIFLEGIFLCHLGDLGDKLSVKEIEKIGQVDVLFVPVGGKYTIDSKEALDVIDQLEPGIVIPMHYGNKDLGIDGLDDVDKFLSLSGKTHETVKTLKLTRDMIPEDREQYLIYLLEKSI